jgi:DNA-binding NarL/FixJ family response regulator
MQSALRELLAVSGPFEVVGTADTETEATDWLQHHKSSWRLAIVDLMLAEGSGFGLVQRCRRDAPGAKVVIFSEFASPAIKERCIELGADAAFMKSDMKSFIHYLEQAGGRD